MKSIRCLAVTAAVLVLLAVFTTSVSAKDDPLAKWKPDFDPSGAAFTYLLSCVGHPAIEGVTVGYRIRDRIWKESNGQLYVDLGCCFDGSLVAGVTQEGSEVMVLDCSWFWWVLFGFGG